MTAMAERTIGISPFLKKKEQAEVGQSPTLLALRYRYGGFEYTQSILCPPHYSLKVVFAMVASILSVKSLGLNTDYFER